jgi:hypothetical protein
MSFLNPWLLGGIAGIASPIIIHLLAKKRIQRVIWAAMKFLRVTVDRQQRRMTLEDIILLILRCLVVALIALALARPALRESNIGILGGDESALLLLDVSGSMSTNDGAEARFEKARRVAEQVVDSLPGGSAVGVWLVSDSVRDVVPEPTHDLALARKAIREAKRGDQATDWQPALRRALDVLRRQNGVHKTIYVITDAQNAGWKGVADTRLMLDGAKKEVQARIITVSENEKRNLGLTSLRLSSALAPVNQPLRFEARVANFGPEELRNVAVSLAIDGGEPQDEQTLDVIPPGGEPKSISLFATFREPGFHTVTARLRADRCPFDDQRTLALRVIDEVNVLLVDGDPGVEPRDSEVFYLRNALTPVPVELRDQYFVKTKTVLASELETIALRDYEAVALANVVDVSGPGLAALEQFVRLGGGLMVFPGSRISTAFYNDQMHRARSLLPAEFGPAQGELPPEGSADRPKDFFTLQTKDYTHRIVEPWRDPRSGTLGTAQFYRALTLIPAKKSDVPGEAGPPGVVVSFTNGHPAIMERTFGFGRVVQFASTADAGWNDLPVRPLFVPLMHRTLGYILARQEERLNVRTGSAFSYGVAPELAGKDVTVVSPGGKRETTRPSRIEVKNNVPLVEFAETFVGGAYEVHFGEEGHPPMRFAAFADPAECDLAEMPATDFKALSDVAQVVRWSPGTDLRAQLVRERTGTELWLAIALAALALAIAELVLGNRWSRSR